MFSLWESTHPSVVFIWIEKDPRLRTGNFKVYIMVERARGIQNMQPDS